MANFEAFSQVIFIKHKALISEEWITNMAFLINIFAYVLLCNNFFHFSLIVNFLENVHNILHFPSINIISNTYTPIFQAFFRCHKLAMNF